MSLAGLLISAFALGLLHSFDVDHLCAVSSFATQTRSTREALRFGVRWGLGHTLTLLIFGLVLVVLKATVPPWFDRIAECMIGVALVLVGLWLIRGVMRHRHVHLHWHEHDEQRHFHMHSHARTAAHAHDHKLTALGLLHGLAGTSGVMLMMPVGFIENSGSALLYIAMFGTGTICSMALFAATAGKVFLVFSRWQMVARFLRGALGATSCFVGLIWIGRTLPVFWR